MGFGIQTIQGHSGAGAMRVLLLLELELQAQSVLEPLIKPERVLSQRGLMMEWVFLAMEQYQEMGKASRSQQLQLVSAWPEALPVKQGPHLPQVSWPSPA